MARPGHEVDGVRARALSAAARILAERGVEELSLRAIADEGEIGAASIYHYFANKEELLAALATSGFNQLARDITEALNKSDGNPPLTRAARAYFRFVQERSAMFSIMYDERRLAQHADLREAEQRTFVAFRAAIDASPNIPVADRGNVAVAFWALGRGIAAMASSQPNGRMSGDLLAKLSAGAAYLVRRAMS